MDYLHPKGNWVFGFFVFCFLGLHPYHMEVPRWRVESELQLLQLPATAKWDSSLICDLHHGSRQHQILNPPSKVRDRTCNLMVPSQIRSPPSHDGNSRDLTFSEHPSEHHACPGCAHPTPPWGRYFRGRGSSGSSLLHCCRTWGLNRCRLKSKRPGLELPKMVPLFLRCTVLCKLHNLCVSASVFVKQNNIVKGS